jgi:hypothetical protein
MKKSEGVGSAAAEIDERIKDLGDWRGRVLAKVRRLIKAADPQVVEEVKWRKPTNPAGVPVWSHEGMICTGETYKNHVRLTFAKGSEVKDPSRLFNANLVGARRAIQLQQGDTIDEAAFKALIRAAVAVNLERTSKPKPRRATVRRSR